ncbi:MAG: hypothetical protein LUC85_00045 [Bacteroidales bacterium]|nr:hypothetical protein [Bacteroidales bacterium]
MSTQLSQFQSFARNFFDEVKGHIAHGYTAKIDLELFRMVVDPFEGQDGKKQWKYPQWGNGLPGAAKGLDFDRGVYEAMMIWDMIRAKRQQDEGDQDCASVGIASFMKVADGKSRMLNTASDRAERLGQLSIAEHIIESIGDIFGLEKTGYIESNRYKESCLVPMQNCLRKLNNSDLKCYNVQNMAHHCRRYRNKIHEKSIEHLDVSLSSLMARNYIAIIYILKNLSKCAFTEEFAEFFTNSAPSYRIPVRINNNADNPIGTVESGKWVALKPDSDGVFWLEPYKKVYAFEKFATQPFHVEAKDFYATIQPPSEKLHTAILDYFNVESDNPVLKEEIEKMKASMSVLTEDLNAKISASASLESINAIKAQLKKLEERAKEFRQSFNKDPEVEKNTQRIKQLRDDFSKEIKAINEKLASLEGDVEKVKDDVTGVKKDVEKVKGDVTGVKEDVEEAKGKTETLGGQLEVVSGDVKGLKKAQKRRKTTTWSAVAAAVLVLVVVCAWQAEAITTWWNPDYPYNKAVEAEQEAIARLQGVDLANYDYAHDGETRALVQRSGEMYRKAIKAYEGVCADDTVKHAERIKRLALMHMTGKGGTIDYDRAARWAKKLSRTDGAGIQALLASMSWTPEEANKIMLRQANDGQALDEWGRLTQSVYTLLSDSAGSGEAFATLHELAKHDNPYISQMASHQLAKFYRYSYYGADGKLTASWAKCDSLKHVLAAQLHLPAVHTLFDTYQQDIAGGRGYSELTVNLALMSKDLGDRELHADLLIMAKNRDAYSGASILPAQDSLDVVNWGMDGANPNTHLQDAKMLSQNGRDDLALGSVDKALETLSPEQGVDFMLRPQKLLRALQQYGGPDAVLEYLPANQADGTPYSDNDRKAIANYLEGLCYANGLNHRGVDHTRADSLFLNAASQGLNAATMAYAAHSLRDFQPFDNELKINTLRTLNEKGMTIYEKPLPFSSGSILPQAEASRLKSWIGVIAADGHADAEAAMAFLCKASNDPQFDYWHKKALAHYQIGAVVYEITARWNDMASLEPDQLKEGIRMLEVALAADHFTHKPECNRTIEAIAEMKAILGENVEPYLSLRSCNFGRPFVKEDGALYNAFLHRLAYAHWLGNNPQCVDAYCTYAINCLEHSNYSTSDLRFICTEGEMFFPRAFSTIENAVGRPGLFAEAYKELKDKDKRQVQINYIEPYDRSYPLPSASYYTLQ